MEDGDKIIDLGAFLERKKERNRVNFAEAEDKFTYFKSFFRWGEPMTLDSLITRIDSDDDESFQAFKDAAEKHGKDPFAMMKDSVLLHDQKFYWKHGVEWQIVVANTLFYLFQLRKGDIGEYADFIISCTIPKEE